MAGKHILHAELAAIIRERGRFGRSVTAIAGPPGAGKSTLAEKLVGMLNAVEPESAAVLPMDGYHYDDMVLVPRGLRPRKGSPETFDVAGFGHMLRRLKANDEAEIAVPVFDRAIEIARAGARMIPSSVRHLVVEGNYLLLGEAPWSELFPLFDTTVMIDVPEAVLEARLAVRWAHLPPEERASRLDGNDLPNGRRVIANSRLAEFKVTDA